MPPDRQHRARRPQDVAHDHGAGGPLERRAQAREGVLVVPAIADVDPLDLDAQAVAEGLERAEHARVLVVGGDRRGRPRPTAATRRRG